MKYRKKGRSPWEKSLMIRKVGSDEKWIDGISWSHKQQRYRNHPNKLKKKSVIWKKKEEAEDGWGWEILR